MLGTRLATGLILVVVLLAILILDEWLAPWFPLWFLTSTVVTVGCALELSKLLEATTARPSLNTVFGGTIALVLANWAPHVVRELTSDPLRVIPPTYDPAATIEVMALAALDLRRDHDGRVPVAESPVSQARTDDGDHRGNHPGDRLHRLAGQLHDPDEMVRRAVSWPDPSRRVGRGGQGVGHWRVHDGADRRPEQALAESEPEQGRWKGRSAALSLEWRPR